MQMPLEETVNAGEGLEAPRSSALGFPLVRGQQGECATVALKGKCTHTCGSVPV
jgi:hypothetical protein